MKVSKNKFGNMTTTDNLMNPSDESEKSTLKVKPNRYCKDYIRGSCTRDNCRFIHQIPSRAVLKLLFRFCHDYQNRGCFRNNCKFTHITVAEEELFYESGRFPRDSRNAPVCQAYLRRACTSTDCQYMHPPDLIDNNKEPRTINVPPAPTTRLPPPIMRDDSSPPEAKVRRLMYEENLLENQCLPASAYCQNCESFNHREKLLHDNINVLLKKVAYLTEKNVQLTSVNEFLLAQTATARSDQSCVITSRHGTSAPVSLATVSVTPVVSLAGTLPTLVPAAASPNLALAPAASQAQILTPTRQILAVSTTQQLMGNSGTLIVTSAGGQQLMQVSDSGTLMGGGQTVVAVTPAQLTLAPTGQQLMSGPQQTAVVQQQLVQQSQQLVQPQLASQHQASQFAAQAQHLAAQQNAHHMAQQSAQAQHMAAAAQQTAPHLVHRTSVQQITISSNSQPMAMTSQAQPISFPMISQSILPH